MLLLALTIFTFWYLVIESMTAAAAAGGYEVVFASYLAALLAVALGLAVGSAFALVREALALLREEAELKAGDARDGARVSLGKLPVVQRKKGGV